MWNSDSLIQIEMFFGAARTIAFARVLITQAGQFVTTVNTVTVARGRCGFDGNQRHERVNLQLKEKILHFGAGLRKTETADQTRTAEVASLKFCCAVSRNSSQMDSGKERKTVTTFGSNCVPLQRLTSLRAYSTPSALR